VATEIVQIPLAGPEYESVSRTISAQESLNLVPEFNARTSKQRVMVPRPGWDEDAEGISEGLPRQFWAMAGFDYAVVGTTVYRRASAAALGASWSSIGTVANDDARMGVADDGARALLCGANNDYVVEGDQVAEVSDPDIPSGAVVAYANGYWLKAFAGSNQFGQSEIDDPSSWDPLNRGFERQTPGNIVDIVYDNGDVLIFKEGAVSFWYESGAATGISFDRVPQVTTPVSLLSSQSDDTDVGGSVVFLGQERGMTPAVYAMAGRQFQKISTPAIDYQLSLLESPEDAISFRVGFASHQLYMLTFPGVATYAFDVSTREWHRWQTLYSGDFVGRFSLGRLLLKDDGLPIRLNEIAAEGGTTPIVFRRVTAPVELQGRPFTLDWVELDCEVGGQGDRVGASAGAVPEEYVVSLYVSENNGATWQGPYDAPLGPEGNFGNSVRWSGLGMFREVVFRVEVTQPILPYFNGLRCGVRVGRS